jgi:Protein of unknown function (DUF1360)
LAEETPRHRLWPYAVLTGTYAAGVSLFLRRWRNRLPTETKPLDVALVGIATHKATRLIAKDRITTVFRVPFTEYEGPGGPSEVEESPRGSGLRHAIGELVVCPYCLGQWVATGFAGGLVAAPRETRFVAGVMSALAISDFLQMAYKLGEEQL